MCLVHFYKRKPSIPKGERLPGSCFSCSVVVLLAVSRNRVPTALDTGELNVIRTQLSDADVAENPQTHPEPVPTAGPD